MEKTALKRVLGYKLGYIFGFLCFFAFISVSLWDQNVCVSVCVYVCTYPHTRVYIVYIHTCMYAYIVGTKRDCDIPFIYFNLILPLFSIQTCIGTKLRMWSSNLLNDNQKKNSVKRIVGKWKHTKKNEVHGCSCWRQTGNQKYGSLVCVCFIKHLFLVLFLAALAAGCQQGSWF